MGEAPMTADIKRDGPRAINPLLPTPGDQMEKSSPDQTPDDDGRASLWLGRPLTAVSKRSTRRSSDWRLPPTRSGMMASSRSGGAVTGRGRLREMTWPGTPTTTELGGTSLTTTA